MIVRWILFGINLGLFVLGAGGTLRYCFGLLFNPSSFQSIRVKLALSVFLLIISVIAWIFRKSRFPLPGIDYL